MAIFQYLKDTRSELNHVAWPTRLQTVVFTILVIAISILVSLYLGLSDFLFTSGLGKVVEMLPTAAPTQLEQPIISTSTQDLIISTSTNPN